MQPQNSTPPIMRHEDQLAFLRASRVPDVMVALYRARTCSSLARREDIPKDVEALYRQVAEVAIMLVSDPSLRDTAEYFAAHQAAVSRQMDFFALPLVQRWRIVQDVQVVIRRFLGFARGEWPAALETYRAKAQADKQAVLDANAAQQEREARKFAVIPGGHNGR